MAKARWPTVDGTAVARADERLADAAFALGVWFPQSLYEVMPVVLPHVVRDNSCRAAHRRDAAEADEWAWPADSGHVRDDNSLLKNLVNYFGPVVRVADNQAGPASGAGLARGWTCSHVWPNPSPWANSFVPNVVWLPTVVSRLSDVDGYVTVASSRLRRLSAALYRHADVHPSVRPYADLGWTALTAGSPALDESPALDDVDVQHVQTFDVTDGWLAARRRDIEWCQSLLAGRAQRRSTVPDGRPPSGMQRYQERVHNLPPGTAGDLADVLADYLNAVAIAVRNRPSAPSAGP